MHPQPDASRSVGATPPAPPPHRRDSAGRTAPTRPTPSPAAVRARTIGYRLLLWAPVPINTVLTLWSESAPIIRTPAVTVLRLLLVLLPFVVLAVGLPSVGRRRRDALLLLVPGWNIGFVRAVSGRLAGRRG